MPQSADGYCALAMLALSASAGQAADVAKGQAAFVRQCAHLPHHRQRTARTGLALNLFGVVGRRAGAVPGSSTPMRSATSRPSNGPRGCFGPWIALPAVMVPGTAMGVFPGVSDRDKDDIVAYVAAQK